LAFQISVRKFKRRAGQTSGPLFLSVLSRRDRRLMITLYGLLFFAFPALSGWSEAHSVVGRFDALDVGSKRMKLAEMRFTIAVTLLLSHPEIS